MLRADGAVPIARLRRLHDMSMNATPTDSRIESRASSAPALAPRFAIETDRLLGLDEVLIAAGVSSAVPAIAERDDDRARDRAPAPAPAARPRFDPALFAPKGGTAEVRPATTPHASDPEVATSGTAGIGARDEAGSDASATGRSAARPSASPVLAAGEAIRPIIDSVRPMAEGDAAARLADLEARHARECPHCTVATAHERLVFGEGDPSAELVFVGEAPGENEDRLGRPFVGRAGEKLDEMIAAMGFRREEVYIANVLKSRPPDNRTPLAHEVERCGPYLLAQLAVIRPKVIVTLGGPATKLLLATELGITRLRGVSRTVELGGATGAPFEVPVMPTYHPAYLLRNYTRETRLEVWDDLKKVLAILGRTPPARAG
jgi:DNA polymerase